MRFLKVAGWILGGLLALVLLAVVWLLFWFDANHYKPAIEKAVQEKTGRTLVLTGDLKLSFWPSLALELGQTTLGNAPGFGNEPMLSVGKVRLGVKVLPLFKKQVQVEAVELDSPKVVLIKHADGVTNWADLTDKDKQGEPDQPETASNSNFNASIERVEIKSASISYDDQAAHTQTKLNRFSLSTGRLEMGKPVDLKTEFVLDKQAADQSRQSIEVKLKSQIEAELEASRYVLTEPVMDLVVTQATGKPLSVNIKVARIEANTQTELYSLTQPVIALTYTPDKGKALPVTITAKSINADLKQQMAEVAALELVASSLKLVTQFKAEQILDEPKISGQLTIAPFALRELAAQFGVSLPVTRDPNVFKTMSLQAHFMAGSNAANFTNLKMKLDDTSMTGELGIADIKAKALRFDLDVDRINIDRYLSPVVETKSSAASADTGPVAIPAESVRGLNIQGQLRVAQAQMSKVQLSAVKLGVDARNDKLRLNPLQATVYEGKFTGDVSIDASGKVPRVSMEEHVAGVNFAPLFKALYDSNRVSGRGNINLKLAGSGADTDALKRTLSGTLDFTVDNGAYEGKDLWWEIRRARALLRQQPVPAASASPRTPFTKLSCSAVVTNGVLNNQDLVAAMQYLKVTGKGSADLVQKTIDYRLAATVLKFPSEAKLAAGTQETGNDLEGLTIPIKVSGPLTDPKIRPDIGDLLKQKAQQELDKQKEKAKEKIQEKLDENKDKLKEKLQDKLKGLLGG